MEKPENERNRPQAPRGGAAESREVRWAAVVEYFFINGFNKREALISAGYKVNSAGVSSYAVFAQPWVKAEIQRRMKKLADKAELTEGWVLERMMRIADAGNILAPYKKVQEDGTLLLDFTDATPDALALINDLTVETYIDGEGDKVKKFKVSVTEPKAALDSLARKLGMFKDSVDVNHGVADRLAAGRDRVRKLNAPDASE